MQGLSQLFSSMSLSELSSIDLPRLQEMLEDEKYKKIEEVKKNYREHFCNIVKNVFLLNEVSVKQLNLEGDEKYPSYRVTPKMMGKESALRGIMDSRRPFIAIKIEVLDSKKKEVLRVCTEVIFKPHPLNSWEPLEDVYVTTPNNNAFDLWGNKLEGNYTSFLYSCGGMSDQELQAVQDLLEGKEIVPPYNGKNIVIRMKQT